MPLADYLATTYEPNGRVYPQLDCYGLARLAAAELSAAHCCRERPYPHIRPRGFTAAWRQDTVRRTTSRPKPGALVAAYSGVCAATSGLWSMWTAAR